MEEMGNARAKAHFEASVPSGYQVPTEHATVREREKWIRDKYEYRRFVSRTPLKREEGDSRWAMMVLHAEVAEVRKAGVGGSDIVAVRNGSRERIRKPSDRIVV